MPGFDLLLLSYGFLLLLLYSFIGWCGEMVYCSLCQRRLCEKRGFLNGPLCPVYGFGVVIVLATAPCWSSGPSTAAAGARR